MPSAVLRDATLGRGACPWPGHAKIEKASRALRKIALPRVCWAVESGQVILLHSNDILPEITLYGF
eukprot:scaffold11835_cov34-Prasinocladus_malaysianus.AAC.1